MSATTNPGIKKLVRPSDGKTITVDRSGVTPTVFMPDGKTIMGEGAASEVERECETEADRDQRLAAEQEARRERERAAADAKQAKRDAASAWPDRQKQLDREIDDARAALTAALADSPAFAAFARWRAAAIALNREAHSRGIGTRAEVPEFGQVIDRMLDRLPTSEG